MMKGWLRVCVMAGLLWVSGCLPGWCGVSAVIAAGTPSPQGMCQGGSSAIMLAGSLSGVNSQNQECQITQTGVRWSWSVTGFLYSTTLTGTYGSAPSGSTPPVVNSNNFNPNPSTDGSTTMTVTTTSSTTAGYWEVKVQAQVSFNSPNCGGQQSVTGNTTTPPIAVTKGVAITSLTLDHPSGPLTASYCNLVTFSAKAFDCQGKPVTCTWQTGGADQVIQGVDGPAGPDPTTGDFYDTCTFTSAGTQTIQVTATDGTYSDTESISVNVSGASGPYMSISAASSNVTLKRVLINGTPNGSGTVIAVTLSPSGGFTGTATVTTDCLDSGVSGSFYDPATTASGNGLAVSFANGKQKTLMLTLWLNATSPPSAHTFHPSVSVSGTATDANGQPAAFGNELILSGAITDYQAKTSNVIGANENGPYYDLDTQAFNYDGFQATVQLPPTDPSGVCLVKPYTGDEVYIYTGGQAVPHTTGGGTLPAVPLDLGFQLGHSGNLGYAPYFNVLNGNTRSQGGPSTNANVLIPGGQSVTLTFEAPGFPDANGTVKDGQGILKIKGDALVNGQRVSNTTIEYDFNNLGTGWASTSDIQLKYIFSIADSPTMTPYNAPPNYARRAFYASGSKITGLQWSKVLWHVQGDTSPNFTYSGAATTVRQQPDAPYVSGSGLDTLP